MTVFMRILMATLLPVMLVIAIVIVTAHIVMQSDDKAYANEISKLAARQVSEFAADKLNRSSVLLSEIGNSIAEIDYKSPIAEHIVEGNIEKLLSLIEGPISAWLVFEPGVLSEGEYYHKTLLGLGKKNIEMPSITNDMLLNPDRSPWYHTPFSTGMPYTNVGSLFDFGLGEGLTNAVSVSYPIVSSKGEALGCIGLVIRYEDLFPNLALTAEVPRFMLSTGDGLILYSSESSDTGNTLEDYGFSDIDSVLASMRRGNIWQEELMSPIGDGLIVCLYPISIGNTGQTMYLYRETFPKSMYTSFNSSIQTIVFAGFLGMILLTFCVFFTTRGIVSHLKRITDSFNNVADNSAEGTLGGEQIPLDQTKVIELDTLQAALVKMMMQLRWAHGHKLKALEAEVEREKLVVAAEAKTVFFAAMSHEIRTPMNAIIGISEIMLHEGKLSQAQEKYVQDIKISADSLLNIINDILDISKLETGKMELHPEHYNFRMLMDNITSLAAHLAASANLRFIYETDSETPPCLYGDGVRLRQVLLNLIGNAIKFTREGYVKLRMLIRKDSIRFIVVDTGIGIKRDELNHIFESFKRIDTRRNREIKGTGLGLSISKNLVEMMDGTLEVDSIHGKGSTFIVTIPLVLGNEEKLRFVRPQAETRYSESLNVLIVDDDRTNLNVSSGLMRAAHGIKCDIASSGREAIKKVQEKDYDLIFMDHMMPELDGVDTTQHIRRLGEKFRKIPIIALTANAVIGTREELMRGGMDDFLSKPLQSDRLREILNAWVPSDKHLPLDDVQSAAAGSSASLGAMVMSNQEAEKLLRSVGVNTYSGMENVGFDEQTYIQSIILISENIPVICKLLSELIEIENTHDFHIHVHGIKGSLASIGAMMLSNEARVLEEASVNGDIEKCRTLLPSLIEGLLSLYNVLVEVIPEGGNDSPGLYNDETLKIGLRKLYSSLISYDFDTISNELKAVSSMIYDTDKGGSFSQAKQLIESFDYVGASVLINNIITQDEA